MAVFSGPEIVNDGLVLHLDAANPRSYPGSGTTWYDLSGNGNDGTFMNGVGYSVDNKGSLVYDGVNDYWICNQQTTETEFQYFDSFTITSLAYINENSGDGYLVNNRITDADGVLYSGWGLLQSSGNLLFIIGGYKNSRFSWRRASIGTTAFNDLCFQKWSHITVTNTGIAGEQKIYINGVNSTVDASDDTNPPHIINYSSNISRVLIGKDGTFSHYLGGKVAKTTVYNRALSAAEIQKNFEATRARYGI